MKYISIFLFSMIFLFSCEKKVIHEVSQKEQEDFMKTSRENEKNRQTEEYKTLNNWIKNNPQFNLKPTEFGYWMNVIKNQNAPKIDELNYVQYTKQYSDLDKNIIYNSQSLGIQNIIVGKTDEIRGIESALKSLGEGDKAILLLPSFFCYGLYGDEQKIGAHQPLLVELEILKVKKKY